MVLCKKKIKKKKFKKYSFKKKVNFYHFLKQYIRLSCAKFFLSSVMVLLCIFTANVTDILIFLIRL